YSLDMDQFKKVRNLLNKDIKKELTTEYFEDIENSSAFDINKHQEYWWDSFDIKELFSVPIPDPELEILVTRDPSNGKLTGYYEKFLLPDSTVCQEKDSGSMMIQ
ncbi:MAG: hypothetical protein MHPSP_003986, partial [Paramarteilia canceri]